jgi:hypothetical protein
MDRQIIVDTFTKTKSYAATGRLVGLSKQRVHQIIAHYYNHGRHTRKEKYRKQLDGKKCAVCKKLPATILHHRDFHNTNDKVENLQPVCKDCHNLLHRVHRLTLLSYSPCPICGKPMKIKSKKYSCARLCQRCYERKRSGKERYRQCKNCGKIFDAFTAFYQSVFCSDKCREKYRASPKRAEKKTFECATCGRGFHPWFSQLRRKKNYCSQKCFSNRNKVAS